MLRDNCPSDDVSVINCHEIKCQVIKCPYSGLVVYEDDIHYGSPISVLTRLDVEQLRL